jgi:hypothetical protein
MKNYVTKLMTIHSGRSFLKLSVYMIVLVPMALFSVCAELLRDKLDEANELLIDTSAVLQKWAYTQKSR